MLELHKLFKEFRRNFFMGTFFLRRDNFVVFNGFTVRCSIFGVKA